MPRIHAPLSAGEKATRIDLGGMAAEVKHQHMLKCFDQSNVMNLLARIIEFAFGKAQFSELRTARQESSCPRQMNEIKRSPRQSIPAGFVCR